MEYFVYLLDVGMERVGIEEEEEEEEEGNHLRKKPVPYCVNCKESLQ
jgi:alanine racemase